MVAGFGFNSENYFSFTLPIDEYIEEESSAPESATGFSVPSSTLDEHYYNDSQYLENEDELFDLASLDLDDPDSD